jgi:hypothetical protein
VIVVETDGAGALEAGFDADPDAADMTLVAAGLLIVWKYEDGQEPG